MYLWGTLRSLGVLLAASNNNNNQSVDQLQQRLQLGLEAADEARAFLQEQEYIQAADSFTYALNVGRKPALALHELDADQDGKAVQWLVDVCCQLALLKLDHLKDLDSARADAWAACVFSQYQFLDPLVCMRKVCKRSDDRIGELQVCKQLLDLPQSELPKNDQERGSIAERIKQLEDELSKT